MLEYESAEYNYEVSQFVPELSIRKPSCLHPHSPVEPLVWFVEYNVRHVTSI